jgi:predicted DNA-binding transcriptional regulator YafY
MQIYRIVNRYYLIINKIKSSSFPSFEDIQEHLTSHDTEISLRTMQRDLQNIRNEFGIDIVYNKAKIGYFINTEHDTDYEYFMRFFEMTVMSGKLTETLKNESDISKYIAFDTAETISGLEYMQKILYAIRENFQIRLKYQRFTDSSPFDTTIAPGFLKEYQNRWYLIAWNFDLEDFRTYGLDRIKEIEITGENFDKDLVKNCKDMFDSVIGVSSSLSKPELIELSFDPEQGKYIKTLPLHHTQTIITDNETEFRILLKVVPNYELTQRILSQGESVEVIKPERLREEIKEICRKIANK